MWPSQVSRVACDWLLYLIHSQLNHRHAYLDPKSHVENHVKNCSPKKSVPLLVFKYPVYDLSWPVLPTTLCGCRSELVNSKIKLHMLQNTSFKFCFLSASHTFINTISSRNFKQWVLNYLQWLSILKSEVNVDMQKKCFGLVIHCLAVKKSSSYYFMT